eukprot:m.237656 g.237656  ORF g.237656 m.237656 type:complete len:667 (+) comp40147_c0_seq10:50-2050(+)
MERGYLKNVDSYFDSLLLSNLPPIIRAVKEDDINKLQKLIADCEDLNVVDDNGFTALHHAAWQGKARPLQEVLLAGADRNKTTEKGKRITVLDVALHSHQKECISSLLSEKFVAGKKDDAEKREFLQEVANMPSNEEDFSPLTLACRYSSSSDVVLELLKIGAHVNGSPATKENVDFLPIHAASACCSEEVVELLLQWGADPDFLTKTRSSPLAHASNFVNFGAFKALMKVGANFIADRDMSFYPLLSISVNLKDTHRSAIFKAVDLKVPAVREIVEMIKLMLEYPEVAVDAQDDVGFTALHHAAEANCREAVELLLNAGADSMIKEERERTPADVSSDLVIKHLLEDYKSEHPVTVIGYRNNMGPVQGKLAAVCFTRRTQCLVSSEGASIEAGSVGSRGAERGASDQQDGSERQESGISLAIPKNALPRPVALTLNYTPNPPVLQMPSVQRVKALEYHPSKSEKKTRVMLSKAVLPYENNTQLIKRSEKSKLQLAASTPPVIDTSKNAKQTVISPFVTITATKPVSLSEDARLKIPHCAESTAAKSKSKKSKPQFRIDVKKQSLGPDNSLSGWTTMPESKVSCTDKEVHVHVSKFERTSTFVAVASSTSEKPIREVMKKKLSFWIVGDPMLEREMYVATVCCTNAYTGILVEAIMRNSSFIFLLT